MEGWAAALAAAVPQAVAAAECRVAVVERAVADLVGRAAAAALAEEWVVAVHLAAVVAAPVAVAG